MRTEAIERVLRALEEIRAGKMVIVTDDEDRENEGDLCMAAELTTAEHINFMAKYARGLICVSLSERRVEELELPMMVRQNQASRGTAFTISVEARQGVSTGISAADRAHTIRTVVDPRTRPSDLVSPGHVFPLKARPGGVLQRTGHTEASVDLARLAGFSSAGVICEIMKDDGTMARLPDLMDFAKEHQLHIVSVADLIQYRMQTERLMRRVLEAPFPAAEGGAPWKVYLYESSVDERQILAFTLGEMSEAPTLVRVHTGHVLGDVFGAQTQHRMRLGDAREAIEKEGCGVILYIPGQRSLMDELGEALGQAATGGEAQVDGAAVLREYGMGAQLLSDLGLRNIRILTNRPRRIPSLEGYGLHVSEQRTLDDLSRSASDFAPESPTRH